MANKMLVSLIGVLVSLSSIVMICDAGNLYTVGDDKGWTLGVDYQAWAQGKQFHVGDSFEFKYAKGVHNVLVVNGSSFANCLNEPIFPVLDSGHEVLQVLSTGNFWFICGFGQHCENGMKLKITITDAEFSPLPAPAAAPEANWPTSTSSTFRLRPW